MSYLTERQRDVLRFIERRLEEQGVAPTLREIAEEFGFSSTATAQKHVGLLAQKGFLRRQKNQKRGLLVARRTKPSASRAPLLPLYGTVAAGSPIESVADDEVVAVPAQLLRSGDHYVLRVRGDSMLGDGIHDGDLVVVQRREAASDGEMVVALLGGEVTLKRLYRAAGGRVRLQPANPTMQPLLARENDVRVQGVVVALLRRY